jgi:hypothetical protein
MRRAATPARSSVGIASNIARRLATSKSAIVFYTTLGPGLCHQKARPRLIRYGFDDLGLDRIIGVTHPGNRASQRVLMKSGLDDAGFERKYYAGGCDCSSAVATGARNARVRNW